jgi:hypothetical protein
MKAQRFTNRPLRFSGLLAVLLVCLFLAAGTARAQRAARPENMPQNISPGLRHLLQHAQAGEPIDFSREGYALDIRTGRPVHSSVGRLKPIYDAENRVLVNVHLNGRMALEEMRRALEQRGSRVAAQSATFRKGIIEAYMPLDAVEPAARLSGTSHIVVQYRPWTNVGATTSQGTIVMRSDVANALGFDGTGTTVGVMSDSYNTSQFVPPPFTTTTALQDVGTGDLPNTTAIPGCEGLKYCVELDPKVFGPGTDEGRGMAQIVHDVAPGASLCFATAFSGELQFALNILDLAFNPHCAADVVADDVFYFDEPMFSDGIVATAAQIVHDNGVSYFSSAGNQAFSGYDSRLRMIPDAAARALPGQAVNLGTIPAVDPVSGLAIDTGGGFHNFNDGAGTAAISQFIALSDLSVFTFQWDDPFGFVDAKGNPLESTDLDLQFFDPATGNWLFTVNTDNFMLDEPIELFQLTSSGGAGGGPPLFLQMVISRKGTNTVTGGPAANLSQHVKYIVLNGSFTGDHVTPLTPMTFGHNSAAGANGVAAYRYNIYPGFDWMVPGTRPGPTRPELEYFSSPGPVLIFIDANGNRLPRPELRLKPDMAAPDGVNTTFFPQPQLGGSDYEALYGVPDGFPNFFGTSAAAPHAAGVAALLIQKGGGPGTLAPDEVHEALIHSAPPRDGDIFFSRASSGDDERSGARVTITAADPEFLDLFTFTNAGRDPNYFTVSFRSENPKVTLKSITLDMTNSGQAFRPSTFPVTQGTSSPGVSISSSSPSTLSQTITVNFSGFTSGGVLRFGVYRVFIKGGVAVGTGGKAGDIMGGNTFTATLSNGKTLKGVFRNDLDQGYRVYDGFGLIDAVNALQGVGKEGHRDRH